MKKSTLVLLVVVVAVLGAVLFFVKNKQEGAPVAATPDAASSAAAPNAAPTASPAAAAPTAGTAAPTPAEGATTTSTPTPPAGADAAAAAANANAANPTAAANPAPPAPAATPAPAMGATPAREAALRFTVTYGTPDCAPDQPLMVEVNNDADATLLKIKLAATVEGEAATGAVTYDMPVAAKGRGYMCFKDPLPQLAEDVKKSKGIKVALDPKETPATEWEAAQALP